MTDWTPGPWECRVNNAGHAQIVRKRKPEEQEFEAVALITGGPVMPNARLMAAAPDLDAALEATADLLNAFIGPDDELGQATLKMAADAKAKARGESE